MTPIDALRHVAGDYSALEADQHAQYTPATIAGA